MKISSLMKLPHYLPWVCLLFAAHMLSSEEHQSLPLDQWTYLEVDNRRTPNPMKPGSKAGWWFGLAMNDTNDGYQDIISIAWKDISFYTCGATMPFKKMKPKPFPGILKKISNPVSGSTPMAYRVIKKVVI